MALWDRKEDSASVPAFCELRGGERNLSGTERMRVAVYTNLRKNNMRDNHTRRRLSQATRAHATQLRACACGARVRVCVCVLYPGAVRITCLISHASARLCPLRTVCITFRYSCFFCSPAASSEIAGCEEPTCTSKSIASSFTGSRSSFDACAMVEEEEESAGADANEKDEGIEEDELKESAGESMEAMECAGFDTGAECSSGLSWPSCIEADGRTLGGDRSALMPATPGAACTAGAVGALLALPLEGDKNPFDDG